MSRIWTEPFDLAAPDAAFTALRSGLRSLGYTEQGVCERLGIESIYQLGNPATLPTVEPLADARDVLIALFIRGERVPQEEVREHLPHPTGEALRRVRILDHHPADPGHLAATVFLPPTGELWVASDLDPASPGLWPREALEHEDFVFSGVNPLTGTFLDQIPSSAADRFLELCAGSGIAALAAAAVSGHVWALDITARCTLFARFNARLNGVGNLTALQGDLFDPVAGEQFDRIVAHPPYVPADATARVFRDGGSDGEEIVRRIFAGVPRHLAPGGRFYGTCVLTDRAGAPVEQRIRAMLGERAEEFDLVLAVQYAMPPLQFCFRALEETVDERLVSRFALYRKLGVERVVSASFALQRRTLPGPPITLRLDRSPTANGADLERLLDALDWARVSEEPEALLLRAPRLSPNAKLRIRRRLRSQEEGSDRARISVDHPFHRALELPLTAAGMLALFDGTHSLAQILEHIRERGGVPRDLPTSAFLEFVLHLVREGVLLPEAEAGGAGGASRSLVVPRLREDPVNS